MQFGIKSLGIYSRLSDLMLTRKKLKKLFTFLAWKLLSDELIKTILPKW